MQKETLDLSPAAKSITLGGTYKHYKGKYYLVLKIARHSETLEEFVVYQLLYGDFSIWIRPVLIFLETVEVDGKTVPRFSLLKE